MQAIWAADPNFFDTVLPLCGPHAQRQRADYSLAGSHGLGTLLLVFPRQTSKKRTSPTTSQAVPDLDVASTRTEERRCARKRPVVSVPVLAIAHRCGTGWIRHQKSRSASAPQPFAAK